MSQAEPQTVKVAGVQCDPKLGDLAANLDVILAKTREAASQGAKLVVFPECALSGYGFPDRATALKHAQPIPGPATEAVGQRCRELGVHVVFGLLEADGSRLFNACVLVGPGGVVGSYRKIHLPFLGVDAFADPGDRPLEVFDIGPIKVGMHICYDGAFPETGRVLALLGADLLILPTNWPTHSECAAEHMVPCRAFESVVYMMAVNRVGEESGFRFIGHSSVANPQGKVLAATSPDREEIFYADIDPAIARQKLIVRVPGKHQVDRIGDRRPGFYGPIVQPNGRD